MKTLARIISGLVRVVACLVFRLLTLALYVPYVVVLTLPELFGKLADFDNWEALECLMHDVVFDPFRQYDKTHVEQLHSEQWHCGFQAGHRAGRRQCFLRHGGEEEGGEA